MALASGSRIGAYEVVALLGAGGMGEVYRAHDTKLNRDVALKILPEAFAADADRLARFKREARVLASLNHPNIAQIYGFEDSGATHALVLELVEGPTLAEIISDGAPGLQARGTIPGAKAPGLHLNEVLPIAKQIAEALEAAHEQGIIHRDLKPANVKVRPDGTVKVLDFGLAKALDPAFMEPRGFSPGDQADSPTMTAAAFAQGYGAPGTQMGVILGTAAYMAPEQARGRVVDKRADIWAFGAVLYEMLTGRRAFDPSTRSGSPRAQSRGEGNSIQDVLAAVLKDDVKWAALPPDVPAPLQWLLRRCLEKDPRKRLRDIGDARLVLEDPATLAPAVSMEPGAPRTRERLAWAAATLFALAAIGATAWILTRPAPAPPRPVQFTVAPPDGSVFGTANSLAISPDGEQLAFGATMNGKHQLWVRALDSLTPRLLPGTDAPANAFQPVWSPNGRYVAFNSGSKLMRADVAGGPPMTLADPIGASGGAGGLAAWSQQGVILFSRDGHLYRIPEGGGQGVAVTELDKTRRETAHRWPIFLPDGRRFIFLADTSDASMAALYLASLDSPGRTHLIDVRSSVAYAQGYLFYQRDGTLMAQPFDERAGRLAGDAEPVVENVEYNPGTGRAAFSVSADGTLACRTRASGVNGTLAWFDRQGKRLAVAGQPGNIGWFQISPDGRTVAVAQSDATSRPLGAGARGAQLDIWTLDLERNVRTRLTSDPADENSPVWSADGRWIFFRSNRKGIGNLYRRASGGGGADELLFESPDGKTPTSASRDGKLLIFERFVSSEKGSNDIWALPLEGEKRPFSVIATPFNEANGALSPDGRWIAYQSMESGDWQIYVQPFPPTGERVRVSTATGRNPQWSADGKQLYFNTVSSPSRLQVADVSTPLRPGIPKELFSNTGGYTIGVFGDRILLNVPPEGTSADPAPITVVLNVTATLKR